MDDTSGCWIEEQQITNRKRERKGYFSKDSPSLRCERTYVVEQQKRKRILFQKKRTFFNSSSGTHTAQNRIIYHPSWRNQNMFLEWRGRVMVRSIGGEDPRPNPPPLTHPAEDLWCRRWYMEGRTTKGENPQAGAAVDGWLVPLLPSG